MIYGSFVGSSYVKMMYIKPKIQFTKDCCLLKSIAVSSVFSINYI